MTNVIIGMIIGTIVGLAIAGIIVCVLFRGLGTDCKNDDDEQMKALSEWENRRNGKNR